MNVILTPYTSLKNKVGLLLKKTCESAIPECDVSKSPMENNMATGSSLIKHGKYNCQKD